MEFEVWCKSDVGLKREINQDSYLIDKGLGLFIVADGMGGHRGGEVASTVAVDTAREVVAQSAKDDNPVDTLIAAYKVASRRIYERSLKEEELSGMGTTMAMTYVCNNSIYIANVGDSRVYLYKKPNLWLITEDHSLVNQQVRAGLLSPEQASNFAAKNIITRSVGFEADVICDVWEHCTDSDMYYLMCSDGLTGLVSDRRIGEILLEHSPEKIVDLCVEEAKSRGGLDNITVMLLKVSAGGVSVG